jgi:hypothetical protein
MNYSIRQLSSELFYIRWHPRSGFNVADEKQFIHDLKVILNHAPDPVYFISDLRQGRITNVAVLNELAHLTRHKHWAGSTAFGKNPLSAIFVNTFSALAGQSRSHKEIYDTPEECLMYLESLRLHLTHGIDWNEVLSVNTGNEARAGS